MVKGMWFVYKPFAVNFVCFSDVNSSGPKTVLHSTALLNNFSWHLV